MKILEKLKEQQIFSPRFNPLKYWNQRAGKEGLDAVMQNPEADKAEQKAIEKLLQYPHFREVKSVLDYGCGTGRFLPLLKEQFQKVWATDFSFEMIKKAQTNNGQGVEFCTSKHLPSVDMTFCFTVFLHIVSDKEWKKTLKRLCNITEQYILICDQFRPEKHFLTARHCKIRQLKDYLNTATNVHWHRFYPDAINGLGVLILKMRDDR